MTVSILQRIEGIPASYPVYETHVPLVDPAVVWQRLEAYIAHRWTEREVIWTVEGAGDWCPDLTPARVTAAAAWNGSAWEPVTLPDSPLAGFVLPALGPYKFTATVGGGAAPDVVLEAARRLEAYLAEERPVAGGVSQYSHQVGDVEEQFNLDPRWIARALQLSGAADLLRPFRRA